MGPQDSQEPQQPQQPVQPAPQPLPPQPQPQPQQYQQFQSMQPQPMMPVGAVAVPAPKKGLSKGAIMGIIGGAVGLLLLLVGIVLAIVLFGAPTRSDFSKAGDKITEANSSYNDMSLDLYDLTSSSSTETSRKNAQDNINEKSDKFNTAFVEAGKLKGIYGDKEVKAKYDAVEAKRATFNATVEKVIEISNKLIPAYREVNDLSSSSTASEIAAARQSLEDIGTLKHDATNTFVSASITYLKALEDYKTYRDSYIAGGAYDANAYTKYSSAYDAYSDAVKDWQSSLEKMSSDAELKDELNALGDTLNTKMISK